MADEITLKITADVREALRQVAALRDEYLKSTDKLVKWTASASDATKALNQFSGDKVIRQAQNLAQAIDKIGGATRLTAKEQQQVNIVITEALAKYRALGEQAPAALHKLWVETKNIGEETKRSGDFFNRAFFRLTGAITAADLVAQAFVKTLGLVVSGVEMVGKEILDLGIQGSKVNMISEGFFRMQNAIGQLGGKTLDVARQKTQGLISDFDMMTAANRAMLFGLEVTPEKFGLLAESAIKLGRAMGLDATKSLDDLVLALGRVSPRILDNLGIIVKVGEANIKWAKANNTTVEAMTAANRVQAFYEESLKKIEAHVKTLGEFSLTLSDRVLIMTNRFTNWRNELALAVNLSPVLQQGLEFIGKALENAFGTTRQESIEFFRKAIDQIAITAVDFAKVLVELGKVGVQVAAEILKGWNELAFVVTKTWELILKASHAIITLREQASFGGARKVYQDMRIDIELLISDQEKLVKANKEALERSNAWARGQSVVNEALDDTLGFLDELGVKMRAASKLSIDYSKVTDGTANGIFQWNSAEEDLNATMENSSKERKLLQKHTDELAASLTFAEKNGTAAALVLKEYGAKITDVTQKSAVFGATVPDIIQRWSTVLGESTSKVGKFSTSMADLNRILSVLPKDMPFVEVIREFGPAIKDANDRAHAFALTVPEFIKAWVEAMRAQEETLKNIKEGNEILNESVETWDANQKKMLKMKADFDKKYLKLMENGREDRLAAIQLETDEAMAALGPMIQGFETEWMEAASAIGKAHVAATDKVKDTWGKTVEELTKTLPKALLAAFSGGGNVMNSISAAIGGVIGPKLFNAEGGIGKKFSDMLIGSPGGGGGLAAKGGLLGGLFKGVASIIPLIGPIIGMLAGPLMKGIKRLFTGPSMEKKVAADLGRDYGQAFSKGLIDKITADSKRLGDRMAASAIHLKELIDEAGGVTMANVDKWTKRTRDLFVFLERGIISSEEATKALNDVVPELAKTFEAAGGVWSKEFIELIDLTKREKLEVQAVTDLINAQVKKMGEGTAKVVGGFTKPLLDLITAADEANSKLEGGLFGKEGQDAFKKGGNFAAGLAKEINQVKAEIIDLRAKEKDLSNKQKQNLVDLEDKLKTLNYEYAGLTETQKKAGEALEKAATTAQPEFDRLSRITLRTFNTIIENGGSSVEAIDEVGGSIKDLATVADRLGLKGNAAFDQLKRLSTLVDANRPLLEQAQGLNDLLVASINLRTLDQEAFTDLQEQGLDTYKKLNAAGFTENETLTQMADFLNSLVTAHEERGFAIDEETEKMIAQAREEGIIKDKQISTNDILQEGLGTIIELLGGQLPEAWKAMGTEAEKAAKKAQEATIETNRKLREVNGTLEHAEGQWADYGQAAEDAGEQAQEAVDGVSFGHSPGGLKEWTPLFMKSRKAMLAFTQEAKREMGAVTRLMADAANRPSKTHTGAVLARYDSSSRMAAGSDGKIVWTGDMNVSTWTLGQERDLIKKKLTPGILRDINDGGDAQKNFDSMVRRNKR